MPLYEDRKNAENRIRVKPETRDSIIAGNENISAAIPEMIRTAKKQKRTTGQDCRGWLVWCGL